MSIRPFSRDRRGAALIEFAVVLPLLMILLFGIVGYGDWMFAAHSLQQAANDGARAAIGGLNQAERDTLAAAAARTSLGRAGALDPARATVSVDDDATTVVVRLSYDASNRPLLASGLLPAPARTIVRSAAIRLETL